MAKKGKLLKFKSLRPFYSLFIIIVVYNLPALLPFYEKTHMRSIKRTWQKLVYYSGIVSFIAAIACLIILYLWKEDLGWKHVYTASLAASSFFFAAMGVVLVTIGTTDLPSLKIKDTKP